MKKYCTHVHVFHICFRKKSMIMITFIMFAAALFGGIPIVANSFECLIVHRALVGLHCGKFFRNVFSSPSF